MMLRRIDEALGAYFADSHAAAAVTAGFMCAPAARGGGAPPPPSVPPFTALASCTVPMGVRSFGTIASVTRSMVSAADSVNFPGAGLILYRYTPPPVQVTEHQPLSWLTAKPRLPRPPSESPSTTRSQCAPRMTGRPLHLAFTSEPRPMSSFASASWPLRAAKCSGVRPAQSLQFMLEPWAREGRGGGAWRWGQRLPGEVRG